MRVLILLHSTTGNTRLMMQHAARWIERQGHQTRLFDVTRGDCPDPNDFDLLGVANPTMYFRGTLTMDRILINLPAARRALHPVFLYATCGGEPGAQFDVYADLLAAKGYGVIGAKYNLAPSNYPHHRFLADRARFLDPVALRIAALSPRVRPLVGLLSHAALEPTPADRDDLEAFCRCMLETAASPWDGGTPREELHPCLPGVKALGFSMTRGKIARFTKFSVDSKRCTACGVCVRLCPEQVISLDADASVPVFGPGCSGCYTCYNHCPEGAIRVAPLPAGAARYHGPSARMRRLFED